MIIHKNLRQAPAEQRLDVDVERGLRVHQNQRQVERLFLHQREALGLDTQSSLWKTHQKTTNLNNNNEETRS